MAHPEIIDQSTGQQKQNEELIYGKVENGLRIVLKFFRLAISNQTSKARLNKAASVTGQDLDKLFPFLSSMPSDNGEASEADGETWEIASSHAGEPDPPNVAILPAAVVSRDLVAIEHSAPCENPSSSAFLGPEWEVGSEQEDSHEPVSFSSPQVGSTFGFGCAFAGRGVPPET